MRGAALLTCLAILLAGCSVRVGSNGFQEGRVVLATSVGPGGVPGDVVESFNESHRVLFAFVSVGLLEPDMVLDATWDLGPNGRYNETNVARDFVGERSVRNLWLYFHLKVPGGLPAGTYGVNVRVGDRVSVTTPFVVDPVGPASVVTVGLPGHPWELDHQFEEGVTVVEGRFVLRSDGPVDVVLRRGSAEVGRQQVTGPGHQTVPFTQAEGFKAGLYSLEVMEGDKVLRLTKFRVEAS